MAEAILSCSNLRVKLVVKAYVMGAMFEGLFLTSKFFADFQDKIPIREL
jgi:hypothetical protein